MSKSHEENVKLVQRYTRLVSSNQQLLAILTILLSRDYENCTAIISALDLANHHPKPNDNRELLWYSDPQGHFKIELAEKTEFDSAKELVDELLLKRAGNDTEED